MDYSFLRRELITLLANQGITNQEVLHAIEQVPRHKFMDSAFALNKAYANQAWTIGWGQTISQPYVVARMTEVIAEANRDKVLEIGTGSGYQAAVLKHLFEQVYTIERISELYQKTSLLLEEELGYTNVYCHLGDGADGWPQCEYHPFSAIICTAAAPRLPQSLLEQLADPGILVAPMGPNPEQQFLYRIEKKSGRISKERLEQVSFVPLIDGCQL